MGKIFRSRGEIDGRIGAKYYIEFVMFHLNALLSIRIIGFSTATIAFAFLQSAVNPAATAPGSGGAVSGVVYDSRTHAPLPNASVRMIGRDVSAPSDSAGRFIMTNLTPGTVVIEASAYGYQSQAIPEVTISPERDSETDFYLEPSAIELSSVTVKSGYFKKSDFQPISQRSLRHEEIRRAPGAGEDIQRAIQALPGVVNSNDQNNEIVVRGGSPSENLTVIDGIEIDNINHFPDQSTSGGPISAVNLEFVKEVNFVTGAFSARYGDRLSSVLGVELRDGEQHLSRGQAELSMAGAGLNVEGKLPWSGTSYLLSYRKSYLDLIHGAVGLTAVPHYWDLQGKVSWEPRPGLKGSVFMMYADDRVTFDSEEEDAWSRGAESLDAKSNTTIFGVRFRAIFKGGFGDVVLARAATTFDYRAYEMPGHRRTYLNMSTDIADQLHLTWSQPVASGELTTGISVKPITFDYSQWFEPDTVDYDFDGDSTADTTVINPPWEIERSATSLKYAGYAEYSWRALDRLTLTGGVRLDGFANSGKNGIGPRFSGRWQMTESSSFTFAGGVHYQSQPLLIYLYDPSGSNETLPHSRATHFVAGFSQLLDEATQFSLEGYLKDYSSLPVFEEDLRKDSEPLFRSWRFLGIGRKRVSGLEFFAQRKLATNWYGTAGYSHSKAVFDDSQQSYPASFDIRNVATVVLGYKTSLKGRPAFDQFQRQWYGWWSWMLPVYGDELTLSTRYRYVSGRPYTPRIWTDAGPELGYHWEKSGARNSARYPDYRRWDIRLDSKWFTLKKSVVVFVEIQNLLNEPNVAEYIYADDGQVNTVYQFRFFFVGGVRFNW